MFFLSRHFILIGSRTVILLLIFLKDFILC